MEYKTLAFILAGGRGSRLELLTRHRNKPSLPFAGKFRLIDFVASNAGRTESIDHLVFSTQFVPKDLTRHIGDGSQWWIDGRERTIDNSHPHQSLEGDHVSFAGTADAVRKGWDYIEDFSPHVVLVLGGDHIYQTTYNNLLDLHMVNAADATIMAYPVSAEPTPHLGIMKVADDGRILAFVEKPQTDKEREGFELSDRAKEKLGIKTDEKVYLASMGNYAFSRGVLHDSLFEEGSGDDFGKNIIPRMNQDGKALYAFPFKGYWRDVGRVEAYFEASMDVAKFEIGSENGDMLYWIHTRGRAGLPPARISATAAVAGGTINEGSVVYANASVVESVVGHQVVVEKGARVKHSILLGAHQDLIVRGKREKEYKTIVGEGSNLDRVITDYDVHIERNVNLGPKNGSVAQRTRMLKRAGLRPYDPKTQKGHFYFTEGGILLLGSEERREPLVVPAGTKG